MVIEKIKKYAQSLMDQGKSIDEVKTLITEFIDGETVTDENGKEVIFDVEKSITVKEAKEEVNIELEVQKEVEKQLEEKKVEIKSKRIYQPTSDKGFKVPGNAKTAPLKNYSREEEEDAYKAGMWVRAKFLGDATAKAFLADVDYKVLSEGTDSAGGYSVPNILSNKVIELVNSYGIIRRDSQRYGMTSDTLLVPKVSVQPIAYVIDENATKTASQPTFEQVSLIAKKLVVLIQSSEELLEDSVLNMLDLLTSQIARAVAYREDFIGFRGTGTADAFSGGMTGIIPAIQAVDGNNSIVNAGVGTGWGDLALTDFHTVMSRLPEYGYQGSPPKRYCSLAFKSQVFDRLAAVAGGNWIGSIENGFKSAFLGYEVKTSPLFDSTDNPSSTDEDCLFGRLDLGVAFGDRRGLTLKTSDVAGTAFQTDQVWIRGVTRAAITVHAPGTGDTAGPIILLQS